MNHTPSQDMTSNSVPHPVDAVQQYYRLHAPIYDATRWSFLFGRNNLIRPLPTLPPNPHIVEVGCGTGRNLPALRQKFPGARITGIDLSGAMLKKAASKTKEDDHTQLIQAPYGRAKESLSSADLVLLSYSLTISSNPVNRILQQVTADLNPEGYVAVVDFHDTPVAPFRRWMRFNNVSLDGTLLPALQHQFQATQTRVKQAYFGLWSYFQFIGRPR